MTSKKEDYDVVKAQNLLYADRIHRLEEENKTLKENMASRKALETELAFSDEAGRDLMAKNIELTKENELLKEKIDQKQWWSRIKNRFYERPKRN